MVARESACGGATVVRAVVAQLGIYVGRYIGRHIGSSRGDAYPTRPPPIAVGSFGTEHARLVTFALTRAGASHTLGHAGRPRRMRRGPPPEAMVAREGAGEGAMVVRSVAAQRRKRRGRSPTRCIRR
jgi:hypothetical protein